jgi:hypothetical protein
MTKLMIAAGLTLLAAMTMSYQEPARPSFSDLSMGTQTARAGCGCPKGYVCCLTCTGGTTCARSYAQCPECPAP